MIITPLQRINDYGMRARIKCKLSVYLFFVVSLYFILLNYYVYANMVESLEIKIIFTNIFHRKRVLNQEYLNCECEYIKQLK